MEHPPAVETVEVATGGVTSFPVEITVPFAHAHGSQAAVRLEAHGDVGAVGRLLLGFHYVSTPQPSGHHDRLWVHSFYQPSLDPDLFAVVDSRDGPGWPFMNSLEEEPADLGASIEPTGSSLTSFGAGAYEAEWRILLQPGLRMGLNVTDDVREFSLSFDSPLPHEGAVVVGRVVASMDGEERTVATLASTPVSMGQGVTTITGTVRGEPGVVMYGDDPRLAVELMLRTDNPDAYARHLAPYLLP